MKTELEKRMDIERQVVWFLLVVMHENGWNALAVDDGGGDLAYDNLITWGDDEDDTVAAFNEVMEAVFAVDESTIIFQCQITMKKAGVNIVLGNDGWDCIADHSIVGGQGFTLAMARVDAYTDLIQEGRE